VLNERPPAASKQPETAVEKSDGANGAADRGGRGLEDQLKAQIAAVEKKTGQMIDDQQREALARLKRRKAEEDAARQRYLEGERKYKEALEQSRNAAAKDRERVMDDAAKADPDMAAFKERVELMKTTERQWVEIKEMLRPMQVASGIELLDPLTGEPNAAAYGLMALSLLLPLVLASEAVSSIVAALQALAGKPDELTSYDPGAYLPPL